MKSKFGKRTGYKESGSTMNIIKNVMKLFLIVGIIMLIIAVLTSPNFSLPVGVLLGSGMLGDPFKTTRELHIPMHSRKGRRERVFTKVANILIAFVVFVAIVGTVWVLASK
jgi:heme/copper-type cytochrome/quinol oxidase subunit 4